jgi:glycosyltransferase involved in cell wall biosynthesis
MKIVHVHQYYNDGMGYQENILPQYQSKLGHDVVLITSTLSNGFGSDSRNKNEGEYKDKGFIVKRIKVNGEFKDRFVVFNNLYSALKEEQPDYIFHHSVTAPSLWTVCSYKKQNPRVFLAVDNHADLNISGRNKLWKYFYYNLLWRYQLSKLDKYIDIYFGVTPIRCLFLNEELGVKKEKIRLLPIGADDEGISVDIDKNDFFKEYNIDSNCMIITHGGKITKEKNADRLINAFMKIKNDNIRLVLFGSIEDKEIENLCKKDDRIVFLGWLNRKSTLSLLKYSDVGIWNTQHTTLLEDCIAVELPLILRYYGSTSHLINNSGMYLYEGSTREIFDKLNFMVNNKELLKSFKSNASKLKHLLSYRNIAYESIQYSEDSTVKETHEVFMSEQFTDSNYKHLRIIKKFE